MARKGAFNFRFISNTDCICEDTFSKTLVENTSQSETTLFYFS